MEHTIFIDIETIPTQSPSAIAAIRDGIRPPGSIKKPESIAAWKIENGDAAALEATAKTSFDPAQGHICTIGWAIDDGDVMTASINDDLLSEPDILSKFFYTIDAHHHHEFVGHYISGFDLRFILCRAVVLGVKIPRSIPRDPKPWGGQVFDTMTAWAGTKGTISLDNLCAALGIPGKDSFSGADVAAAWANGEHEKIAEYCRDDVERVRSIWRKFQAAGW
ncbi:MAG: ribonuclease H-like domain-containing protein [Roseovarius sp.]|nr:ribonuclease H-like domain-containing protein [Roseovarius sp.]